MPELEQHLPPLSHNHSQGGSQGPEGIRPSAGHAPGKALIPYSHLLFLSFLSSRGARWPGWPSSLVLPHLLGDYEQSCQHVQGPLAREMAPPGPCGQTVPLAALQPPNTQLLQHHSASKRNIPALCTEPALTDRDSWPLRGHALHPRNWVYSGHQQ